MGEMPIFMCKNCPKCVLTKIVQHGNSKDQYSFGAIVFLLSTAATFVNRHIGSGQNTDLIYWSGVDGLCDLPCEIPQPLSFFRLQDTTGVYLLLANQNGLDHLKD